MRKIKWLLFILISFNTYVFSQKVLMERNVKDYAYSQKTGPNLKTFNHFYMGVGMFPIVESDNGKTDKLSSLFFNFGWRYKYKVNSWYSLGFETEYNHKNFRLIQDNFKIIPNAILHKKEKIVFDNFQIAVYNRINIGKRGNTIGYFIDLGLYGEIAISIRNKTFDEQLNNSLNAGMVKTVNYNLSYPNRYNYGITIKLGYEQLVFFASYRISTMFKSEYNYPELTRINVGVQVGFHK